MAIIHVIRKNKRVINDTLHDDICTMWDAPETIMRTSMGILSEDPEFIFEEFDMVSKANEKAYGVRSHIIRILLTEPFELQKAWEVFNCILEYFAAEYQTLLTMSRTEQGYLGTFLLNAVSYKTHMKFSDYNMQYIDLKKYMETLPGIEQVECTVTTLFDPEGNTNNYV
jgi:hypothetical protein